MQFIDCLMQAWLDLRKAHAGMFPCYYNHHYRMKLT